MSLFVEVMAYNRILKRWREDPTRTKHQIGVWDTWIEGGKGTNVPLSEKEILHMKNFLRRVNPSGYNRLFPN